MHKSLMAVAVVLIACSTPAYRASEVPVPATYNAGAPAPAPTNTAAVSTADIAPSSVHVSAVLATAPFWSELGDTTLTMLVRGYIHGRAQTPVPISGQPVETPDDIKPLHPWRPSLVAGDEGSTHA